MQSVVDRTGVPADTIRSWERRHGFPNPARDAQNQRVYSEQDIQAILRLKEQTAQGVTVKEALRLLPDVGRGKLPASSETMMLPEADSPRRLAPRSHSSLVDQLVDALLAFDGAAARTLLHTELVVQSPESVVFESILPTAERLALHNDVGGAYARTFLGRIVISLFNASDPDNGRDRIVIARVPGGSGSRDSMLALAHALAVSKMGFAAVWLEGDGDVADIRRVISGLHPLAVLLVADGPESLGTAERWWELLDELPSLQRWTGKRLIASPQRPLHSRTAASEAPLWLAPQADATHILAELESSGKEDAVPSVSNQ